MNKIRRIIKNIFIKSIKQNVMRNKPQIVRDKLKDKLKDKIIRDIWTLFETEEETKDRKKLEKKKNIMKD